MEPSGYAVSVPVGTPTAPPPRLPPILIPGTLTAVQLAEPWRRVVAWLVDVVPFVVVGVGLTVAFHGAAALHQLRTLVLSKSVDSPLPTDPAATLHLLGLFAVVMVLFVGWVAYRVGCVARTGGKWLMGIAVVDAHDPRQRPSVGQGFKRWGTSQVVAAIPLPATGFAPYLWVLKDAKRQGLHDRAAGTLVVKRPR